MTPGNIHDSKPYLNRLDRQVKRFGFSVEAVGLDAGYLTTPICHGLAQRNIFGVIAHRLSMKGNVMSMSVRKEKS
ncbi:hypothetical protein BN982_01064 [Halobacillus karajensis]|uniref:Transposase DDE domain protein n=1 Tax=Halobacillus karajensis TaxID=195088 RepID=A0A024P3R5_9BACI|nr:hypothetical protein BN982_01064 [Halobacillus karajensis]CDQ23145.1 hypothetical protein BN983_01364 [Halobacillus karajensis]CDQ26627.1 hypothetical protein BN981_00844 [Halobacillus karajensis]